MCLVMRLHALLAKHCHEAGVITEGNIAAVNFIEHSVLRCPLGGIALLSICCSDAPGTVALLLICCSDACRGSDI